MKNIKLINLRALTILLVVLGHSIILYSPKWGIYQTTKQVYILELLKDIINIIQMPIFFAISGYLFYKTIQKNLSFIKFSINKLKRLIIPFCIVGIFWMIPIKLSINYYQSSNFFHIVKEFLIGNDVGHLWYVVVLFLIFILMFLLKEIIKGKNVIKDIIITLILLLVSITSTKISIHFYLVQTMNYAFYFYIGILLNKYEEIINHKKHQWLKLAIPLTLLSMIITIYFESEILTYWTACLTIIVLYEILPNRTNKILNLISDNSFGIYLLHSPLVYITYAHLSNASPIIVVGLNFIVFGSIALLLTIIIRKIKLGFIIGE